MFTSPPLTCGIPHRPSPIGPEDFADQQKQARRKLVQMERMEDFARQYDDFEELHGEQLPSWQIPAMREHYANTYRQYVGVHPIEREELRRRLELLMR